MMFELKFMFISLIFLILEIFETTFEQKNEQINHDAKP